MGSYVLSLAVRGPNIASDAIGEVLSSLIERSVRRDLFDPTYRQPLSFLRQIGIERQKTTAENDEDVLTTFHYGFSECAGCAALTSYSLWHWFTLTAAAEHRELREVLQVAHGYQLMEGPNVLDLVTQRAHHAIVKIPTSIFKRSTPGDAFILAGLSQYGGQVSAFTDEEYVAFDDMDLQRLPKVALAVETGQCQCQLCDTVRNRASWWRSQLSTFDANRDFAATDL